MNGAPGDRRWFLTDAYGRRWRLSLPTIPAPAGLGAARPAAGLRGLIDDAFAPWGTASPHVASSLLAICEALGDRRLVREHLDQRRGDTGWRERLDRVRTLLVSAAEAGWLRIDPAALAVSPPLEESPDTERDLAAPVLAPEAASRFELRVVDEVGEPIAGIDVAFGVGGGRRVVPTDGGGVARLEDASSSFISASVSSVAQLREKLAPRWTKPRTAKLPTGPDTRAADINAATQSLSLESEKPFTLAITPFFKCNELSGVHFAFGRSFLLESALDTLSIMAAAVLEDDNRRAMIFGHTDTAGSDALNKELSERRGKAILAVLTHDPDAWEELWTGSDDGPNFKEQWGVKEAQHLLNALGVTDDEGKALVEDGVEGHSTHAAMRRFQRGDYPGARAGRSSVPETGKADKATRKEFLLSFADEITHDPVPKKRFAPIGSALLMGCGEYNPLSDHARDAASRRTVLFIFDAAATPQNLPCKLRSLGPCKTAGGVDDPLPVPLPDDKPYRCSIYREIAKTCPCVKGEELMHLELQLHDRNFDPAPDTAYALVLPDGERVVGKTDSDGILHAAVRKAEIVVSVTYQPATEPRPVTIRVVVAPPDEDESDRAFVQKIRNMGFGADSDSDAFAILRFQTEHKKLRRTGKLDDDTKKAVRDAMDEPLRKSFDDDNAT